MVLSSVVLLLIGATLQATAAAKALDREQQLQREREKLEKETNPIDRAKIGIRISELLLEDVGDCVREGNFTEMEEQLDEYGETIQTAHQSLIDSGRNAQKKPSGFKELEIALRKHARIFEDFGRMLNLQRRVPLEKAKDLAVGIRNKLLKSLFP